MFRHVNGQNVLKYRIVLKEKNNMVCVTVNVGTNNTGLAYTTI